ncbi:MAG: SIMPL domain-containing protein [Deltaproteobacteria bacterium]|nr:SIMPL domain-containing protein [Deltaproteobacteria bacterium]
MKRPALIIWLLCSLSPPAGAEQEPDLRTISVTGDADVLVVPDEAVLRFSVQAMDGDLDDALDEVDSRAGKVLHAIEEAGIAPKQLQTDRVQVWPDYDWRSGKNRGYRASRDVVVTLEDVKKLEEILRRAFDAGATGMGGVTLRTSELRKHKDRARLLAVRAAQEKALALASALGAGIGRPQRIVEEVQPAQPWWWGGSGRVATNAVENASPGPGQSGETTALGEIRINAKVTVCFELR